MGGGGGCGGTEDRAAFAVVHVGLHRAVRRHAASEFRGPSARGLVLLAGGCGAAYLAVVRWEAGLLLDRQELCAASS